MAKARKKLTSAQKRAKKKAKEERQKKYMWVFMNGKQVRIKRPETIDGVDRDEFIRNNADPIWLHRNEMWEYMDQEDNCRDVVGISDLDSYIYHHCGQWKDREGNILVIEPIDEKQVHVTYVKSGENEPLLRPWLNNMPACYVAGPTTHAVARSVAWEPLQTRQPWPFRSKRAPQENGTEHRAKRRRTS